MKAGRGAVLRWEALGALFMVAAGSLLHFAYDWSGGWRPLALVAAVDESVWEHLKLAFWPGLAWAAAERAALPGLGPRLWAAKGLSLALTAALIVAVFRGYTAILGDNLLALDIGTFVLAVCAGQAASARMLARGGPSPRLAAAGRAALLAQIVAFSLFTAFPPDHPLFVDPGTGLAGPPPR